MCVFVVYYFYVFHYSLLLREYVAADNYLTKIVSKNELLNLHGIYITVIIKSKLSL